MITESVEFVEWTDSEEAEVELIEKDDGLDALACLQSAVQHHEDHTPHATGGSFSEHVAFEVELPSESAEQLFAEALMNL